MSVKQNLSNVIHHEEHEGHEATTCSSVFLRVLRGDFYFALKVITLIPDLQPKTTLHT